MDTHDWDIPWWRRLLGRSPFKQTAGWREAERQRTWRDAPDRPTGTGDPSREDLRIFLVETDDWTFVTPAQGDAYAFRVDVHCAWYASRTSPAPDYRDKTRRQLNDELQKARRGMVRRIETEVRRRAREFPPYRPAEAEDEIGAAVRSCLSNGQIQCVTSLRVWLSDEVRQQLEPYWQQKLSQEMEAEYSAARARQMDGLQKEWARVLDNGFSQLGDVRNGDQAWMAPWSLQLAEKPKDVAQVLSAMLTNRLESGKDLLDQLDRSANGHHQVGAYEFVVSNDTALRNILLGLGLKISELPEDSPLKVEE